MADTKISALTAASALTGAEIVPVLQSSADRRTTAQDIADLAAAGGLFGAILSAVPTQAGTGLNSWLLQPTSATVADSATGIVVYCPSQSSQHTYATIKKTAPSTPYVVKALIALNAPLKQYAGPVFGWSDGTKALVLNPINGFGIQTVLNSNVNAGTVTQKDSIAEVSSTNFGIMPPQLLWLALENDGTNVKTHVSIDGANYRQHYTETISGGSLTNYNTLIFGVEAYSQACRAVLMSYEEAASF